MKGWILFGLFLNIVMTFAANRRDGTKKHHKVQVKEEKEVSGASLHPSWEASKRRKEQESKLISCQGQRTVFSDSD